MRCTIAAALLLASIGCGRGVSDPSVIGESMPAPGVIRFTIDGVTKQLTASATTDSLTNIVTIGGEDAQQTSLIAMQTVAALGTHSLPDTSVIAVYATGLNYEDAGWAAYGANGTGTITIKSISSTSVTGTFSFTLVPYGTASGSKVVGEGAFNSPLFSN